MNEIFISYKREESRIAKELAAALEGEGWSVWWDPKIRSGERFDDVIEQALKKAKVVVVLWSTASVGSQHVKDEASYALNRNKLVPALIEAVDLPFRFERINTQSLIDWNGSAEHPGYRKLVADIACRLGEAVETAAGSHRREPKPEAMPYRVEASGETAPKASFIKKSRSRWPMLYATVGWALGWMVMASLTATFIESPIRTVGLILGGAMGGCATALALRQVVSGFHWKQIMAVTCGFSLGFPIGMYLSMWHSSALVWSTTGGAIGGLTTALVLKQIVNDFRWFQAAVITIGFALAFPVVIWMSQFFYNTTSGHSGAYFILYGLCGTLIGVIGNGVAIFMCQGKNRTASHPQLPAG